MLGILPQVPSDIIAPMFYHIWTEGCQMNVADSQRVASALERLGYQSTPTAEKADVIVLNTCVVRQSAEDKAVGRLHSLKPLKVKRPDLVINLMGCMVGVKGARVLGERFPFVDVFSPPSDPGPLVSYLSQEDSRHLEQDETIRRFAAMDGEMILPLHEQGRLITSHVPVVYGCSHACTFCIIPYRRGPEQSRPVGEIAAEVRSLVRQGVREVTLLGQIVDRYGKDIPDGPNLASLLRVIHEIDGLERIRFLTSHPNWMTDELLEAVAALSKVCPHIEVPVQAGDDEVLLCMKRGYTVEDYRRLIEKIRRAVPGASIATDIIVGFPGETDGQFQRTFDLLAELRLDVAHLARYSPRPGTVAERRMPDDVPDEEKWRRFRLLEDLQEGIAEGINADYLGETVEVLFEEQVRGRWKGRTPTNKLVFTESDDDLRGRLAPVQITWTGPWSMQGRLAEPQTQLISRQIKSVPILP
ncbi:MAG TPA: tRNA (N6-isopentenyl adenosine(37)-C2)-methylthiotransferase MiaB [Anaerolineales bacterium]|nr:tRNA (N6-isopentenyl adenosine(37)-C2)-methylthiotransferase MiaB [Anaerolineales bacterium]